MLVDTVTSAWGWTGTPRARPSGLNLRGPRGLHDPNRNVDLGEQTADALLDLVAARADRIDAWPADLAARS